MTKPLLEPGAIFSVKAITEEELTAFLLENGGILTPDSAFLGQLYKGEEYIYVSLSDGEIKQLKDDEELQIEWRKIIEYLGAEPRSCIGIGTDRSTHVGRDFVCNFALRWPCLYYDYGFSEDGRIYSHQELLTLCEH